VAGNLEGHRAAANPGNAFEVGAPGGVLVAGAQAAARLPEVAAPEGALEAGAQASVGAPEVSVSALALEPGAPEDRGTARGLVPREPAQAAQERQPAPAAVAQLGEGRREPLR